MYITILVKHVYWYISQVSGERLQDHWSSGVVLVLHPFTLDVGFKSYLKDWICLESNTPPLARESMLKSCHKVISIDILDIFFGTHSFV